MENPEVKGKPVPGSSLRAADSAGGDDTSARRHSPIAAKAGARRIRAVGAAREAFADHRYDLPGRPSVVAGDPRAHPGPAGHVQRHRSRGCRIFSAWEIWGGATFDTSMRFLNEDPWQSGCASCASGFPTSASKCYFRGANAVGYTSYPDNVIVEFVREAHAQGIDIFRIFRIR